VTVTVTVTPPPGSAGAAPSVPLSRATVEALFGGATGARSATPPLRSAPWDDFDLDDDDDDDDALELDSVEVAAVADESDERRARRRALLVDRLLLWAERSAAYALDDAGLLLLPDGLEWRRLGRFRRPLPAEFPSALVAEFLSDALDRD
jgi:hypothetical protein